MCGACGMHGKEKNNNDGFERRGKSQIVGTVYNYVVS